MIGIFSWIGRIIHPVRPEPSPLPTPPTPPAPGPGPAPLPDDPATISANVIAQINVFRAKNGKNPLTQDVKLDTSAQDWAIQMATKYGMTHGNFSARIEQVYPNSAGAENIAMESTVNDVVLKWINSYEHRINMLGDYMLAGVGESNGYFCLDLVREV